jgi:hypothetical protein
MTCSQLFSLPYLGKMKKLCESPAPLAVGKTAAFDAPLVPVRNKNGKFASCLQLNRVSSTQVHLLHLLHLLHHECLRLRLLLCRKLTLLLGLGMCLSLSILHLPLLLCHLVLLHTNQQVYYEVGSEAEQLLTKKKN